MLLEEFDILPYQEEGVSLVNDLFLCYDNNGFQQGLTNSLRFFRYIETIRLLMTATP